MHQTITNVLRPLFHTHVPQNDPAANNVIDTALATASYASQAAVHCTLFCHDMFLDIPLLADLETIRNKRQVLINKNLRRQNLKCLSFDYQVGQQVLILNSDVHPAKLDPTSVEGTVSIVQVHTNGYHSAECCCHGAHQYSAPSSLSRWTTRFYAVLAFLILFPSRFFPTGFFSSFYISFSLLWDFLWWR
jgi:hypothetical protein